MEHNRKKHRLLSSLLALLVFLSAIVPNFNSFNTYSAGDYRTISNPIIHGESDTTATVIDGYFFNYDSNPFPGDMVVAKYVEDENVMCDFDSSKVTFEDTVNGGNSPMTAYRVSETDFTYELNVFYDCKPLYYEDGTKVIAKAYIGIKGDTDLNSVVNSSDASNVLAYYATIMTKDESESTRINLIPELDKLSIFLADIDYDCYYYNNWK